MAYTFDNLINSMYILIINYHNDTYSVILIEIIYLTVFSYLQGQCNITIYTEEENYYVVIT